jgi:predicted permease
MPRTSRQLRAAPRFTASVAFVLGAGVALAVAVLGFADAGLAHVPPHLLPLWERTDAAHGWTEQLRTVEEMRHAGVQEILRTLWGAAALVLASACVIAAARVLARGAARRTDVAMRVALGAGAGRVARFAMADAGVAVLAGGALGAGAGWLLGLALRATWPAAEDAWTSAPTGARALLLGAALPVAVGVACALAPVATAFRRDLTRVLGTGDRATAGRFEGWLRHVLTIGQFALSMALLVGAGVLLRASLGRAPGAGSGLDPRDTLTMRVELPRAGAAQRAVYLRDTLERVRAVPGVRAVSATSEGAWLGLGPEDLVTSYCKPSCVAFIPVPVLQKHTRQVPVSPGYFAAMGIRVRRGRELRPDDRWAALVTNAAAARLFPGQDPVGQHLLPWRERSLLSSGAATPKYRVVGVVDDVAPPGPGVREMLEPMVYLPALRHPPRVVALAVRTAGNPMALAGAVGHAVRAAAPGARILDAMTMEERLARFAAPVRWGAAVLAALAVAGAALACVGLFGVVQEGVARRTREIGVRMALGAEPGRVVREVVRDAMRLARTALFIGLAMAFALARTLQTIFQGVQSWDPLLYAGVAALLTAVALLASWLPARRAASVDPMVAIRAR